MKPSIFIKNIVSILQTCLPSDKDIIALHEPSLQGNEWNYVKECLDTRWVSSVGKYVDQFEEMLKGTTGAEFAVAVVNGTAALHIALKLVGVAENDEVLVPSLTFIATANAVKYCGAIPHFVDCEERTLGIDPSKLRDYLHEIATIKHGECYNKLTGRKIKAVVPMHTFGHPVDLDPLISLTEEFKLELVEDAAESLGSYYKGKHTGTLGKVSALSFNGNKIITTGGGGAILTNDPALGKLAKHLTTTAKVPHKWKYEHDYIGYNYRLPNINAALGCAQLEQLEGFLERKRMLAKRYTHEFEGLEGVSIFKEQDFARSNYWLNALILDTKYAGERDVLLEHLNQQGIMARPFWEPLHTLNIFSDCPQMELQISESLASRVINIPSTPTLVQTRV
ncbi:LegC family aminotransferase [Brevibacillus invocatus]|uniref:LegC family aminotransferase n=1 Tax=Brevibacillus invocatus TaxID=173959 RepID=UPI00204180A3|nr:LegC family aminotransferase [Brevibacillus invocatus]MCM3079662.1 LegC family aminotransferase [Brevibacillus invocatus]MCM3431128.1 LegC family aminotransferase [Brevibacillus invocatus]